MTYSVQTFVEEYATLLAHPIGIYVCAKRSRFSPRVRLGAFLFTAITQTIWERDLQIQNRRVLLELANNREARIDAYKCGIFVLEDRESSVDFYKYCASWWMTNLPTEEVEFLENWDKEIGNEIKHKLEYFYTSKAILFKSLVVGASLGTLPFIQRMIFGAEFRTSGDGLKRLTSIGYTDPILHAMYTRCFGLPRPYFLNPKNADFTDFIQWLELDRRVKSTGFRSMKEWRSSPQCWFSRQGKLPLWKYNVEDDTTVLEKF